MRTIENGAPRMDFTIASKIIADAAEGLHSAHDLRDKNGELLGLVHRDVTPHNLFVTYEGTTKVVDFGIAKVADRLSSTRAGTLKGKLAYMSPEQVRAKEVDRGTDIFALGVVLWELTTGNRLFRRESDLETLEKVQACIVPPPSHFVPDYPVELESIVMKALAKDRRARFQTARDMSRALQKYVIRSGTFVGAEEVAAYLKVVFLDRIQQRNEHLSWAAEVTQTINIEQYRSQSGHDLDSNEVSALSYQSEIHPSKHSRPRPAAGTPAIEPSRSAPTDRPPARPKEERLLSSTVGALPAAKRRGTPEESPNPTPNQPPSVTTMAAPRFSEHNSVAKPSFDAAQTLPLQKNRDQQFQNLPSITDEDDEENIATIVASHKMIFEQDHLRKGPTSPAPGQERDSLWEQPTKPFGQSTARMLDSPQHRAPAPAPVSAHANQSQGSQYPQAQSQRPANRQPNPHPSRASSDKPRGGNADSSSSHSEQRSSQILALSGAPRSSSTVKTNQRSTVLNVALVTVAVLLVGGLATLAYFKFRHGVGTSSSAPNSSPIISDSAHQPETVHQPAAGKAIVPSAEAAPGTSTNVPPALSANSNSISIENLPIADSTKKKDGTNDIHGKPTNPADAAGGIGFLTVVCSPACDSVVANGRFLGASPVIRAPLRTGSYRVVLRRQGSKTQMISVVIEKDKASNQRVSMGP
jgi:eukaryotic-like serine/threonine-protein kinase